MKKILFFASWMVVSTIELWSQTVLLPIGSGPFALDINPQTNIAIVANRNSNSVSIINLADNTIKKTITVGSAPVSVAINPVTNRAVVANFGSDTISVIDIAGESVVSTIEVGTIGSENVLDSPRDVAIDTKNNVAIVANLNSNSVSLVDLNTNANILTTPIRVGNSPISVAYNPENDTALIANNQDNNLSVVDLKNRAVIRNIAVGLRPVDIAVNLQTKRAAIANTDTNDMTLLNLTDNSVVATVTVGARPLAVGINPNTNIAAVLLDSANTLSLVNLSGDQPSKYTTVISAIGQNPVGLTVNPNNNTAMVPNLTADSIVIVPLGFLNFLPYAFDTDSLRTNLGINNLSANEATVEIELRDKDGKIVKKASTKVPARGLNHIRNIIPTLLGSSTLTHTRGSLKLMSDQPISSFLSIIDTSSTDASFQIGQTRGFSRLLINAATNVGAYRSQLVVLNMGNTPAALKFTAYDEAGQVLATKTGLSVPVNGFYFVENIFSELGLSSKFGALEIESPNLQPLIAVSLLSNVNRTNGLLVGVPIQ